MSYKTKIDKSIQVKPTRAEKKRQYQAKVKAEYDRELRKKYTRVKGYAKQMRSNPTPHEAKILLYIKEMGSKCFFQKIFYTQDKKRIPMIVDFYLPLKGIVIESDGKQHSDDMDQFTKDTKRDSYLRSIGLRILRIKNDDMFDMSFDEFKEELKKAK